MEEGFLFAAFVFLAAALAVVPIAKATGLGSVLGYLIAGVLIGPYALAFVTDPETILGFSEFGVVMMLFLIGLEIQPRELWNMRTRLLGMGFTQVLISAALFAGLVFALGFAWQSSVAAGLALALSSTAIALQIMGERSILQTETGRSGFSILLFQDIAVIFILAVIPLLVVAGLPDVAIETSQHNLAESAPVDEPAWLPGVRIIAVFAAMYLAGRFLLRPIMRFIAKTGIREIFTALALFLVVGAALLMEWIGLSAALGAFAVGMILADSEFRHELESDIEPFKGLLLGLFFISVGTSIEFSVLFAQPVTIAALVATLVVVKFAVLFSIAKSFRLVFADCLLLAILLAQGGEFAFVLLQFALIEGAIPSALADMLNVTVALSMAITPVLVLGFDRIAAPLLRKPDPAPGIPDIGETAGKVLVLGYGRFGQIIGRLLHAQGFDTTLIDHDPAQIEQVARFGFKVFYGDAARLDLLKAAGAAEARLIVVAIDEREHINAICDVVKHNFPNAKLAVRALSRGHAFELLDRNIDVFERETFRSALTLAAKSLMVLGYAAHQTDRIAKAFERHDDDMLHKGHALRSNEDADALRSYYIRSRDILAQTMRDDRDQAMNEKGASWQASQDHIDTEAKARSSRSADRQNLAPDPESPNL
jgi:glutathione-regulated potassium-efflux system protein KefB